MNRKSEHGRKRIEERRLAGGRRQLDWNLQRGDEGRGWFLQVQLLTWLSCRSPPTSIAWNLSKASWCIQLPGENVVRKPGPALGRQLGLPPAGGLLRTCKEHSSEFPSQKLGDLGVGHTFSGLRWLTIALGVTNSWKFWASPCLG